MPDSDASQPVSRSTRTVGDRYRWLSLLAILPCVGAILGLVVGVISGYVLPKKYESVAMIQVHPPEAALGLVARREGETTMGVAERERFVQTEFEVIRAPETLMRVVDRLDLGARWGGIDSETALAILRSVVRIEPREGTDLVRIRVRHSSPQDARDIADAVTRAYAEQRNEAERERASNALNALDTEIRNQEDVVEERRKLFHTIVKAVGIPYIEGVRESGFMGRDEEALLRAVHREEAAVETEKNVLELQIKTMLRLTNEELLHYLVLSERAPELNLKLRAFSAKANELEVQRAQLGDGDPKLSVLEKEVELLKSDLQAGVVRFQEKLHTDLTLLDGRLEKMKEIVADRRDDAVDKALQSEDYIEAKLDFEAARAVLAGMKEGHSMQRIALKVPKFPITIHEVPTIAHFPSGPDADGLLLGGSLLGAALGLLLALPIAGLMVARE